MCVHNAGRSQMAAGFLAEMAQSLVIVRSAGSLPSDAINPVAVEAMAEVGIDISSHTPELLLAKEVELSDVVITMGCGATPVLCSLASSTSIGNSMIPLAKGWQPCALSGTRSRIEYEIWRPI